MLDLIFTNEDYMIENLRSIAPLGKSDHVGALFTFITYSAIDSRAQYMVVRSTTTGRQICQK